MLEMIGGGSRAETPMSSGMQRKSPTAEQGTQAGSHHLQGGRQQQKGGIVSGQHRQNKEQNDRIQNQSDHSRQPNRPRSQNRVHFLVYLIKILFISLICVS